VFAAAVRFFFMMSRFVPDACATLSNLMVVDALQECVQRHLEADGETQAILDKFLFRINSVLAARNNKYVLLNAPNDKLNEIIKLLPGMKSPTVMPLADSGWSSVHSVMGDHEFWENIDALKAAGAQGILIVPIEKMVL
jgi:ATP phosphoribosyltransferase